MSDVWRDVEREICVERMRDVWRFLEMETQFVGASDAG